MRFFSIITILFFIISSPALAAVDTTHVGFVDSSIWFDREPFFSGEEVRIYTTLANSSSADFSGTIEFYEGETTIGSREITLERDGGFQVVWTDWTPEEGNYEVGVKITKASLTPNGGEPELVEYINEPGILERFVDTDTDGDGIGNIEDNDDDNDGILDSEDTNPLVKDEAISDNVADEDSIKEDFEDKSTEALSKIGEFASSTSPKIIAGVGNTIDAIEEFREKQSKNIDEKLTQARQEIEADQAILENTSEGDEENSNNPFNQIQLLALTAASYTLSHKIAFYITGIFILYFISMKFIPFIYRLIRGREDY